MPQSILFVLYITGEMLSMMNTIMIMTNLLKTTTVSQCNRWIAFIDTLSKGKKNDHVTYNSFLKYINKWYEQSSLVNMNEIKYKILHTDNCGNQFKCHQNFASLLSLSILIITLIHKFAQKF